MLKELQEKKAILKNELEEFRKKRNELNTEASKWSAQRNELNRTSRTLLDKAQHYKQERDEHNRNVSESKANRDKCNKKINATDATIDRIKKSCNLSGSSVNELKKEIESLEFRQQTHVMSPDKERELVTTIASLINEYKAKMAEIERNVELKSAYEELEGLRNEAALCHEKVTEYADKAQEFHDWMIKVFKEGEGIRIKSDRVHRKFVKIQDEADRHHQQFIKTQKEIRELDKTIHSITKRGREDRRKVERLKIRKEAEVVYTQFRQGEKISTEDLMLLQRSDLL